MGARPQTREREVFLNVPFDRQYERLFVALLAGLCALGRTPRCVLEITSKPGRPRGDRLGRILELILRCRVSIHDLSRVQPSDGLPRLNMPFELGLAVASSQLGLARRHVFVFEAERFRLQRTLSDLAGYDPEIHGGDPLRLLDGLLNLLGRPGGTPSIRTLEGIADELWEAVAQIKRVHRAQLPYSAEIFRQSVAVATEIATRRGVIR